MSVKGKSLRSLSRVIKAAKGENNVRFALELTNQNSQLWERIGFPQRIESGQHLMPTILGKACEFNSQGRENILTDLPKETVYRSVCRDIKDWHGSYHTVYVSQPYKRYPREHVEAPSEQLYCLDIDGLKYVVTRAIDIQSEDEERVLHLANLMLECFGEFQIIHAETGIPAGIAYRNLQWRVLPPGKYPWRDVAPIVREFTDSLEDSPKHTVERRVETITRFEPDFIAVGEGGFRGYFVYGFTDKELYVLESLYLGNATYIFGSDWELLSKLTKSEILNGALPHNRIIHDKAWSRNIWRVLN